MILALSTSSPRVSVSLMNGNDTLFYRSEIANRNASELLCGFVEEGLDQAGARWSDVSAIVVDCGPGSFTGVKVGVAMAKVWAKITGALLYAVTSFDLIERRSTVAIPHKRGSYCVREPGMPPYVSEILPDGECFGYSLPNGIEALPDLRRLMDEDLRSPVSPELLVPLYVAEPNISQPRQPYYRTLE